MVYSGNSVITEFCNSNQVNYFHYNIEVLKVEVKREKMDTGFIQGVTFKTKLFKLYYISSEELIQIFK